MLRNLLDTNLCIRILRDRPASLRARFNAEAGSLCTSMIVLTELLHGAFKSARPTENRQAVSELTALVEVLPLDQAAAYHAADIKTNLEKRGLPIGGYDVLIAGHARSKGLVVITTTWASFLAWKDYAARTGSRNWLSCACEITQTLLLKNSRNK